MTCILICKVKKECSGRQGYDAKWFYMGLNEVTEEEKNLSVSGLSVGNGL